LPVCLVPRSKERGADVEREWEREKKGRDWATRRGMVGICFYNSATLNTQMSLVLICSLHSTLCPQRT
jgi:hypothetical protein